LAHNAVFLFRGACGMFAGAHSLDYPLQERRIAPQESRETAVDRRFMARVQNYARSPTIEEGRVPRQEQHPA
jgi:hypothetical protein